MIRVILPMLETGNEDIFTITLKEKIFNSIGVECHYADYSISINTLCLEKDILIVTSNSIRFQIYLLEQILSEAYSNEKNDSIFGKVKILFLSQKLHSDINTIKEELLKNIIDDLSIGLIWEQISPIEGFFNIQKISYNFISSKDLRECIESYHPSGVGEIHELIFRDQHKMHNMFNAVVYSGLYEPSILPSIRMLYGAFSSGEISRHVFESTILLIEKTIKEKLIKNQRLFSEVISGVEQKHLHYNIKQFNKSYLSQFLYGRNIFVFDTDFRSDCIDIALCSILENKILNSESIRKLKRKKYKINGTHFTRCDTYEQLLSISEEELMKYDIILFNIYPVHKEELDPKLDYNNVAVNREYVAWIKKIKNIDIKQLDSIKKNSPKIIVFSRDRSGVTAQVVLKKIGADDYFFKNSNEELYKGGYFSSFRNIIISSLTSEVYQVTHLTTNKGKYRFDRWLSQFYVSDRPHILRMMKQFKYYTAINIVKILNYHLENEFIYDELNNVSYLKSKTLSNAVSIDNVIISYLGRPNKSGPATMSLISKTNWLTKLQDSSKQKKIKMLTYSQTILHIFELYRSNYFEPVSLILVDDVIGSGGQLVEYLQKLFLELFKEFKNHYDDSDAEYKKFIDKIVFPFSSGVPFFQIHIIYAIGLKNRYLNKMMSNKLSDNISLINLPLCNEPRFSNDKKKLRCKSEKTIPVYLHVIDLVSSYIDNKIKDTIKKYPFVTKPRDYEYCCNFEPYGWKNCAALVATYSNVPGNTIPLIWGDNDVSIFNNYGWMPIYNRYFNPLASNTTSKVIQKCKGDNVCVLCNEKIIDNILICKSQMK